MKKRRLTIVIDVDQSSKSHKWLYESHMKSEFENGIKVIAFHEGDALQELDKAEKKVEKSWNK